MKLGLSAGYWGSGPPPGAEESIAAAESLGFDSMWTAGSLRFGLLHAPGVVGREDEEAPARYVDRAALSTDTCGGGDGGDDAGSSLRRPVHPRAGCVGPAGSSRVGTASRIRGRWRRTREYIEIVRRIMAREKPVEFSGHHYQMPYAGGTGLGKPLKSTIHPLRTDIPIFLAAEGPKNVAMAAEIADGWLPLFFSPKSDTFYRDALAEGFARPGARRTAESFEVAAMVPVIVNSDIEAAADMVRPMLALYVGGMGARGANFHFEVLARLGYEETCIRVQDLYLSGKKREAMAAIPTSMVEDTALIGPIEKIRDDLAAWNTTALTTMLVGGPPPLLGSSRRQWRGDEMKLGFAAGYWSSGPPPGISESIAAAESLGFDSLWTAEAYGSDCFTPLAWWGAKTSTIKLGTSITQLSARTPAATAMAAMTLDHLSDGRMILGSGRVRAAGGRGVVWAAVSALAGAHA